MAKANGWLFGSPQKRNEIVLGPDDDRVISLQVTDQYGEVYSVMMEFLNHGFQIDEVQISCHKIAKRDLGKDSMEVKTANRILYREETVVQRKNAGAPLSNSSVWYEFHEIKSKDHFAHLPGVMS